MKNGTNEKASTEWRTTSVYAMAAVCLLLGTATGYLLRGSSMPTRPGPSNEPSITTSDTGPSTIPSLKDVERMADKEAQPLLAKLKADPENAELLEQTGAVYQAAHQFKEAADYYQEALEVEPSNVAVRSHKASCLYYWGDVDGALAELERLLQNDPGNANALFNLGVIRWKGKQDAQGAIRAWQKLLEKNPSLEATKKGQVQRLMSEAREHTKAGLASANPIPKQQN